MKRDFTYIDDIIEAIVRILQRIPKPSVTWHEGNSDPSASFAPYKLYNIGNGNPVGLMEFIETIENELGIKAKKNMLPMEKGDVPVTCADVQDLERDIGFKPKMDVKHGIRRFLKWYKDYYKV